MIYMDPKTKDVFSCVGEAAGELCIQNLQDCRDCCLGQIKTGLACPDWAEEHPSEAVQLMGLKAIPTAADKETAADTRQRPRICDILGVEAGERFRVEIGDCCLYPAAFVEENGVVFAGAGQEISPVRLCQLINGELRLTRVPQWTEQEAEDARQLMRFFGDLAICRGEGVHPFLTDKYDRLCIELSMSLFPSLRRGQRVPLRDIAGEEM